jgi:hypothetical protein
MSSQLIISGQTGGTPPYQFYVCDEFMNNCFLLGQTGGTFTLNTFFSSANVLLIKVVDSTGCINFKYVYCQGETFYILTETELIITTESGDRLLWIC